MSPDEASPTPPDRPASYKDLRAYQEAQALARLVYEVTNNWPAAERGGLCSQVRRAATSVYANIAEGNVRRSRADYLRFLDIANASLAELDAHLSFARTLALVPADRSAELNTRLTGAGRLLRALIAALRRPPPRYGSA